MKQLRYDININNNQDYFVKYYDWTNEINIKNIFESMTDNCDIINNEYYIHSRFAYQYLLFCNIINITKNNENQSMINAFEQYKRPCLLLLVG